MTTHSDKNSNPVESNKTSPSAQQSNPITSSTSTSKHANTTGQHVMDKVTKQDTSETTHPLTTTKDRSHHVLATTLSLFNLCALVGLASFGYYHTHNMQSYQLKQNHYLQQQVQHLSPQLDQITKKYTAIQQLLQQNEHYVETLQKQFQQQQQSDANVNHELTELSDQLNQLQHNIAQLSSSDLSLWLLSEAHLLIKQAARKLTIDQEIKTAIILLKSADTTIVDLHDPSLFNLRQAINHDIDTLAMIKTVDSDGLDIKLNQLASRLDQLPLKPNLQPRAQSNEPNYSVSNDPNDWRHNLANTWHNLVNRFMSIKVIKLNTENKARPELTADQTIYLLENIRFQLLSAAQSAYTHQQLRYQAAITQAIDWINEYYDVQNYQTQTTLAILADLQKQPVQLTLPDELTSLPLINNLIEHRLHQINKQAAQLDLDSDRN